MQLRKCNIHYSSKSSLINGVQEKTIKVNGLIGNKLVAYGPLDIDVSN